MQKIFRQPKARVATRISSRGTRSKINRSNYCQLLSRKQNPRQQSETAVSQDNWLANPVLSLPPLYLLEDDHYGENPFNCTDEIADSFREELRDAPGFLDAYNEVCGQLSLPADITWMAAWFHNYLHNHGTGWSNWRLNSCAHTHGSFGQSYPTRVWVLGNGNQIYYGYNYMWSMPANNPTPFNYFWCHRLMQKDKYSGTLLLHTVQMIRSRLLMGMYVPAEATEDHWRKSQYHENMIHLLYDTMATYGTDYHITFPEEEDIVAKRITKKEENTFSIRTITAAQIKLVCDNIYQNAIPIFDKKRKEWYKMHSQMHRTSNTRLLKIMRFAKREAKRVANEFKAELMACVNYYRTMDFNTYMQQWLNKTKRYSEMVVEMLLKKDLPCDPQIHALATSAFRMIKREPAKNWPGFMIDNPNIDYNDGCMDPESYFETAFEAGNQFDKYHKQTILQESYELPDHGWCYGHAFKANEPIRPATKCYGPLLTLLSMAPECVRERDYNLSLKDLKFYKNATRYIYNKNPECYLR